MNNVTLRRARRCSFCYEHGHTIANCTANTIGIEQTIKFQMQRVAVSSLSTHNTESAEILSILKPLNRGQLIIIGQLWGLSHRLSRPRFIEILQIIYLHEVRQMKAKFIEILEITNPFLVNNQYVIDITDFITFETNRANRILEAYEYGLSHTLYQGRNEAHIRSSVAFIRANLFPRGNGGNDFVAYYIAQRASSVPVRKLSTCGMLIPDNTDDFECAVCIDTKRFDEKVETNCNHSFCGECMDQYLEKSNTQVRCPMCRTTITTLYTACVELHNHFSNKY